MSDTLTGYICTATQMSRDLLTLTGGVALSIKGIVKSSGFQISFSSDKDEGYNVYLYQNRVFRVVSTNQVKANQFEFIATVDILSTIYHNSGNITIQTNRHHSPSRCISREWGGEEVITTSNIISPITIEWLSSGVYYNVVFVSIVSSHNTLLNTNGDLIRYIIPVVVGDPDNSWWGDFEFRKSTWTVMYPSLNRCICDIETATGLDSASIIDVSVSTISPYVFSTSTGMFMYNTTSVEGNCTHLNEGNTYTFYQIDKVDTGHRSLKLTSTVYNLSVSPDSSFNSFIPQDMNIFIDGRKSMDLVDKNGNVSIIIKPYLGYTGIGYTIAQGDNVTTVLASKLPWMGDAWVSYQIQKKGTDEAKMWYDTAKSVASIAIGIGGSAVTGGATAMSVPSSVASLGDAYVNQQQTEEYTKKVPYGSGSPYGDVGGLMYMLLSNKSPAYVLITKYSGQPSDPITRGKTIGYPARGSDTITTNGFFKGDIISMNVDTVILNQDEVDLVSNKIVRGVRT